MGKSSGSPAPTVQGHACCTDVRLGQLPATLCSTKQAQKMDGANTNRNNFKKLTLSVVCWQQQCSFYLNLNMYGCFYVISFGCKLKGLDIATYL